MHTLHWLAESGQVEKTQVCAFDFADRAMAADFAFALYAAVHGFARDRLGFEIRGR